MKKLILTVVAVFAIAFCANAQFYGGAGFGFNLVTSDGHTSSSLHFTPGVGYTFSERSSAGIYLALDIAGGTQWTINPYYRFTFASVKNAHFFTEAKLKIGQTRGVTMWGLGLVPGLAFSLTDKLDIVARAGYLGLESVGSSTAFGINILQDNEIGVQFKF